MVTIIFWTVALYLPASAFRLYRAGKPYKRRLALSAIAWGGIALMYGLAYAFPETCGPIR